MNLFDPARFRIYFRDKLFWNVFQPLSNGVLNCLNSDVSLGPGARQAINSFYPNDITVSQQACINSKLKSYEF